MNFGICWTEVINLIFDQSKYFSQPFFNHLARFRII